MKAFLFLLALPLLADDKHEVDIKIREPFWIAGAQLKEANLRFEQSLTVEQRQAAALIQQYQAASAKAQAEIEKYCTAKGEIFDVASLPRGIVQCVEKQK